MKLLLDTCTFLWLTLDPDKLPDRVRESYRNEGNDIFFSVVSIWEIAIKHRLGKARLPDDPERYVPLRIASYGLNVVDIKTPHGLRAGALPLHHKDPFDRMIIAQAELEDLVVMTPDEAFRPYGVPLLW